MFGFYIEVGLLGSFDRLRTGFSTGSGQASRPTIFKQKNPKLKSLGFAILVGLLGLPSTSSGQASRLTKLNIKKPKLKSLGFILKLAY